MLGRCYDLAAMFRLNSDLAQSRQLFEKALTILNDDVRDFPSHTGARRELRRHLRQPRVPVGLLYAR